MTAAVAVILMVGLLGLAADLGRVYIVKNELQNFADAAAFAAVMEINGIDSGITRARSAAGALPNKWNFSTQSVADTSVAFGPTEDGDTRNQWDSNPTGSQVKNQRYVRVVAAANVPLLFLPVANVGISHTVRASSVAGKVMSDTVGDGFLLPFAPMAPSPGNADGNFGFVFGLDYTLRWGSNIGNNGNPPNGSVCSGDLALGHGSSSTVARQRARDPHRGYWGSSSTSSIRDYIANGYPNEVSEGDIITLYSGEKNGAKEAMNDRVDSDTDGIKTTYADYEGWTANGRRVGNGRRVVVVPVISGFGAGGGAGNSANGNGNGNGGSGGGGGGGLSQTVLGFAAFFLNDLSYDVRGNQPFCATYIGAYTQGANTHSGAGNAGVSKVRLVK